MICFIIDNLMSLSTDSVNDDSQLKDKTAENSFYNEVHPYLL